jgi:hypothetical protein
MREKIPNNEKENIDIHTHKIKYLTLDLNAIAVDNLKSCYNILKYIVAKIFVARMIRQNRYLLASNNLN